MKKVIIFLTTFFFLVSGCYKSWNGLNFKYTKLEKSYRELVAFNTKGADIEFFVIKYGTSIYSEVAIYHKGDAKKNVPFDWLFYLIKGKDFILLIDTGFADKKFIKQFAVDLKDPLELLAEAKVMPGAVTHVIITHAHFDHIGLVDKYENAKIIIHEDALASFYQSNLNKKAAEALKKSENLQTFSDDLIIFDSILISPVGGHAPGSAVVFFMINNKKIAILGDEAYFLSNVAEQRPVGVYVDLNRNIRFLKEIMDLDGAEILTFHDTSIAPGDLGVYQLE